MAGSDPKRALVEGRRRLLTIHDGARLTPTLVAMLATLTDAVNEHHEARMDPADGIALYVESSGEVV